MGEMDSRKSVKIPFIFKKSRLSCNLLKLFHFLTAFNTKNGRILIADTTPLFHPFWAVQQVRRFPAMYWPFILLPERSDGLFTLLFEKLSATRLKLFARTAQTRLFHRRQSNGRINKVPTPVYFHKCRQFMMALSLPVLFKIRLKLDQSMQLAKRHMTDNLQSRPLRLLTPRRQILLVQQILLRRDSRVHDIVDFLQNIRTVTRTHQLFRRRGRRLTRMKRCATFRINMPRLTGAKCSRHS